VAQAKKKRTVKKPKTDHRWIAVIFLATIAISIVMSFIATNLLNLATLAVSFVILICIVLIGILFDVVGVAVTAASETPFHAMASRKVPEAQEALHLVRNANRVSSFCNDVIGDICGVISGSASAVIAGRVIAKSAGAAETLVSLLMSALVAGLTVGGKAYGKSLAIQRSTEIVQATAKVLHFFGQIPARFGRKKL
jgi:CBS domain containing-hemolysin-like protein